VLRRRYRRTGAFVVADRWTGTAVVVVVGQCSVVVRHAAAGGERAEKGMRVARRSAASLAGPPQPLDKKYYYTTIL